MDILVSHKRAPVQVLFIPHILASVLVYLGKGSQAACALVCRAWYGIAVDVLWQKLEDPHVIFLLITTFKTGLTSISEEDWERFAFYAQRVKRLEFSANRHSHLDMTRLNKIAILKPMHYMTPNVTHLTWAANNLPIWACLVFLSPSVTSFTLEITPRRSYSGYRENRPKASDPSEFLKTAATRCGHLRHFELRTTANNRSLRQSTQIFLSRLKTLESVRLPPHLYSGKVWSILATIPSLEGAVLAKLIGGTDSDSDSDSDSVEAEDDSSQDQPSLSDSFLQPDAFSSLRRLQLQTSVDEITSLFHSTPFPSALRTLALSLNPRDFQDHAEQLFIEMGDRLISIVDIGIDAGLPSGVTLHYSTLPMNIIRPLTACKQLENLLLELPCVVEISEEEMLQIITAWAHLKLLCLSPRTHVRPQQGAFLPLRAIPNIVQSCPKLQSLTVPVDPSTGTSAFGVTQICRLRELGLSMLSNRYNEEDVAIFLAQLTPAGCDITIEHFDWVMQDTDPADGDGSSDLDEEANWPKLRRDVVGVSSDTVIALLPYVRRIDFQYKSQIAPVAN